MAYNSIFILKQFKLLSEVMIYINIQLTLFLKLLSLALDVGYASVKTFLAKFCK